MAGAGFAGPWLPFAASSLANPAAPRPLFSGLVSLFRRLVAHHCTYLQWPFPPLQVRSAGQGRAVASVHTSTVTRTYRGTVDARGEMVLEEGTIAAIAGTCST